MTLNLEDIARLAGVSRSTVSRVINNHPNVREATKEKVLRVIHEQNFQPNPVARMLVTQRTEMIGVVVSQTATVFFNDPSAYFPTIIQGIADVTNEHNYGALLWLSNGVESEDTFYRRIISNRLMDGLILISASSSYLLVSQLVETSVPFVTIERPLAFADQVTYVSIDNFTAARQIVRHLIDVGRRQIGIVTGPANNSDAADRLQAYRVELREAGLPAQGEWVFEGAFTAEAGYAGGKALIGQGVDAIVASSDQIAVGVLQACREAGVRVPDDVALVGFDDLPTATAVSPQLTTVYQPAREKGVVAARLLLDMINGLASEPQHILLPTHLVVRQSCGAARVQNPTEVRQREV